MSFRSTSGPGGMQKPPRNPIKFEQDFDFEQANNKFEELRSQLAKLKVGDEPKSEQVFFISFLFVCTFKSYVYILFIKHKYSILIHIRTK